MLGALRTSGRRVNGLKRLLSSQQARVCPVRPHPAAILPTRFAENQSHQQYRLHGITSSATVEPTHEHQSFPRNIRRKPAIHTNEPVS
jgi:hypothetical protein